jgi:ribosomal protein S27AE
MSERTFQSLERPIGSTPDSWYDYHCAQCGHDVTGLVVARHQDSGQIGIAVWLLCPNCGDASIITKKKEQFPAPIPGPELQGLPPDIATAYNEARKCLGISALSACSMMCRKILMHVAIEKGAQTNQRFEQYVDYLQGQGFISPTMKPWVDSIRRLGNEGAHDLEAPTMLAAESALIFAGELLRVVYEMQFLNDRYSAEGH